MREKYQIAVAKAVSLICEPYYLPLVVYLALMSFSYLKLLPMDYKLMLLGWFVLFTVVIPLAVMQILKGIITARNRAEWLRKYRWAAYVVFMINYEACLMVMKRSVMPQILQNVIFAALVIQLVCFALNFFIKVSAHSAAAGGLVGALVAFAFIFGFDPRGWLCVLLVFAGLVGTSRLLLRRHTLREVNVGLAVGFVGGLAAILLG